TVENALPDAKRQREPEQRSSCRQNVRNQHSRESPGVRAQEGQEPPIHISRALGQLRGVSNASGTLISSGDTPPCRNDPRYLLWYSRSFVGYTKKVSPTARIVFTPEPRCGRRSASGFVYSCTWSGFSARMSSTY